MERARGLTRLRNPHRWGGRRHPHCSRSSPTLLGWTALLVDGVGTRCQAGRRLGVLDIWWRWFGVISTNNLRHPTLRHACCPGDVGLRHPCLREPQDGVAALGRGQLSAIGIEGDGELESLGIGVDGDDPEWRNDAQRDPDALTLVPVDDVSVLVADDRIDEATLLDVEKQGVVFVWWKVGEWVGHRGGKVRSPEGLRGPSLPCLRRADRRGRGQPRQAQAPLRLLEAQEPAPEQAPPRCSTAAAT